MSTTSRFLGILWREALRPFMLAILLSGTVAGVLWGLVLWVPLLVMALAVLLVLVSAGAAAEEAWGDVRCMWERARREEAPRHE